MFKRTNQLKLQHDFLKILYKLGQGGIHQWTFRKTPNKITSILKSFNSTNFAAKQSPILFLNPYNNITLANSLIKVFLTNHCIFPCNFHLQVLTLSFWPNWTCPFHITAFEKQFSPSPGLILLCMCAKLLQ